MNAQITDTITQSQEVTNTWFICLYNIVVISKRGSIFHYHTNERHNLIIIKLFAIFYRTMKIKTTTTQPLALAISNNSSIFHRNNKYFNCVWTTSELKKWHIHFANFEVFADSDQNHKRLMKAGHFQKPFHFWIVFGRWMRTVFNLFITRTINIWCIKHIS